MLNEEGGIETDLSIVCIEKNYFRVVTSATTREQIKLILKNICHPKLNLKILLMSIVVWIIWPNSRK